MDYTDILSEEFKADLMEDWSQKFTQGKTQTSYINQLRTTQMFNEYPVAVVHDPHGNPYSVTTHGDIFPLRADAEAKWMKRTGIKTSLDVPNHPERTIVGATMDDQNRVHMIGRDGNTYVCG